MWKFLNESPETIFMGVLCGLAIIHIIYQTIIEVNAPVEDDYYNNDVNDIENVNN